MDKKKLVPKARKPAQPGCEICGKSVKTESSGQARATDAPAKPKKPFLASPDSKKQEANAASFQEIIAEAVVAKARTGQSIVNLRIPTDLLQQLDEANKGLSRNAWIVEAIKYALKN
jgi:hypothetical protein